MEITKEDGLRIKVKEDETPNGCCGSISSQSVEACLLFAILEKLEEIRCGIIDVEDAVNPR